MTDQMGILPSLVREDAFEIAVRGYQRRQVDEFVAGTREQIRHLQERLNQAQEAHETSRRELTDLHEQYASRPAHEVVSERMSQILKLAEEEADQSRARAEEDIAQIRRAALEEAQRICDVAREQADTIIEAARQQSEQDAQRIRGDADSLLQSSRRESESTLLSAQQRSEQMLGSAEARATAVNDVVERRLEVLTTTHADATQRLTQMRDLLVQIIGEDEAAGPLRAAVDLAGDFPIVVPDAATPVAPPAGADAFDGTAPAQPDAEPTAEAPEQSELLEQPDQTEQTEQTDRFEQSDQLEQSDQPEISEPRVLDVDEAAARDAARTDDPISDIAAARAPASSAESAAAAAAAAAAARGRHHRS